MIYKMLSTSLFNIGYKCNTSDFNHKYLNKDPIMKQSAAIIPPAASRFNDSKIEGVFVSKVLAQVNVTLDNPIMTTNPILEIGVLSNSLFKSAKPRNLQIAIRDIIVNRIISIAKNGLKNLLNSAFITLKLINI
ncbi:hypothetical protein GCM10023149_48590 [Mucilaginibacter gynuensis]|uniref:Uncharacterized protein n=1 Tax=Mucilaginibacter gynuensis TaxID=1302236 RepID=A0ABP8HF92_9SPHI